MNKKNLNEQIVLDKYKELFSLRETANYFGTSIQPINRILNKYNVSKNSSRKYKCNFSYFENIDTEEKAYWLGFLYADGYVRVRKTNSEFKLKIIDKDHLIMFNKCINSNYPITKENGTNCWKLCISSKKLVADLINKGCVQKKSLILTFPNESIVSKNLQRHFIRGYFDGDGCIHFNINNPTKVVEFLGTKILLEKLKEILLEEHIDFCEVRKRTNCNIYSLKSGTYKNILLLKKYFYDNNNICLNRKKIKFDLFYQIYLNRRSLYE